MASHASAAGRGAIEMLIMVIHYCLLELVRAYLWLERKLNSLRVNWRLRMKGREGREREGEDDDRHKLPRSLAYILDARNRDDWTERLPEIIAACWRRRDQIRALCLHGNISRTCMEQVMQMWSDAPITFYENETLLRGVRGGQGQGQDLYEFCIIFATYDRGHSYFAQRLDQAKQQGLGRHQRGELDDANNKGPLRTQEDLLTLLKPFPLIDLVICEDPDHLNLSSLLAVTIGFAQLYHCTSAGSRAMDQIEEALIAYGQSKQNYGK